MSPISKFCHQHHSHPFWYTIFDKNCQKWTCSRWNIIFFHIFLARYIFGICHSVEPSKTLNRQLLVERDPRTGILPSEEKWDIHRTGTLHSIRIFEVNFRNRKSYQILKKGFTGVTMMKMTSRFAPCSVKLVIIG